MNTIQNLFQQAQLAEAAYANFFDASGNLITSADGVKAVLIASGFSSDPNNPTQSAQAAAFLTQWEVVDQYTANGIIFGDTSGFSATLFRNKTNGQYSFAMRGSQSPVDFLYADFSLATGGVALDQLFSMVNYVLRLDVGVTGQTAQLEVATSLIDGSRSLVWSGAMVQGAGPNIPALSNLTVTGHSLGGALAQMYQRIFDSLGVNTFNSMGIGNANSPFFDQLTTMLGLPVGSFSSGAGSNLVVSGEPANHLGTVLGDAQIQIFTETENTLSAHMMGYVTDSLALYNLFVQLDPTLNIAPNGLQTITDILKAESNVAANSLESAMNALGKLFNVPGAVVTGNAFDTNRDLLYTAIAGFNSIVNAPFAVIPTIQSLTSKDAATLVTNAKTDIAYRYALQQLNPFVALGMDYSGFNVNGELDLYSIATYSGNLTDQYLADRTAFLTNKILANTSDNYINGTGYVLSNGVLQHFQDDSSVIPRQVFVAPSNIGYTNDNFQHIHFGSSQSDTLTGYAKDDHLYGMGGNDILQGNGGNDYLEGGNGLDAYVFNTGGGRDSILDTDGLGSIVYDSSVLSGGTQFGGSRVFRGIDSINKEHTYIYLNGDTNVGGDLLVDGKITIKNFHNGNLGIALGAASPIALPQTTNDIFLNPRGGIVGDTTAKNNNRGQTTIVF